MQICFLTKYLLKERNLGDRKSERVYQMGDWEEEMDARTGAKRIGDAYIVYFSHWTNAFGFSISRRRKRLLAVIRLNTSPLWFWLRYFKCWH